MAAKATALSGKQAGTQAKVATAESWRTKGWALLRITFGLIWAIDAWFKWQPDFIQNFVSYVTSALDGQPPAVQAWIHFWEYTVRTDPTVFAYIVALAETALAISLIFGFLSNVGYAGGILLAFVIWSTAEGFGGPYMPGSTDIGAAIIYMLVFVALFLASAGLYWGVDRSLTPRLGRFGYLASGTLSKDTDKRR
jgi:uncharacterized membrane protein YphA (DoxX/SURF4 family)